MRALAVAFVVLALSGCANTSGDDDGTPDVPTTPPEPQSGRFLGRVTLAEAAASHDVLLLSGHKDVRFGLVLASNLPQSRIELNVTAPDGRTQEVETSPLLYALPGIVPVAAFEAPETGTWVARVGLAGGALADYEVHWCTASARDEANLACPRP